MESIQSRLTKSFLKFIHYNRLYQLTGSELWNCIEAIQDIHKCEPPLDVSWSIQWKKETIKNHTYFVLEPKNKKYSKTIFYLYGGGYVAEISQLHWRFLKYLINHTGYRIILPMYPLAPDYSYKDVFEILVPLYEKTLHESDKNNLILMGDSSGASIALALSQLLTERSIAQPARIVALSPSVDMTVSNPDMYPIESLDPILAIPGTREIGSVYAGDVEASYYLVSPLYGNMKGLPQIDLFVGTHELCLPDCRKFVEKCKVAKVNIGYHEYHYMVHNWPLLFFPESKKARKEIISILTS
ncbi:MAG: alpha/beta hydrolase fold domain-containing protein [Candidatus Gracilibacteria bacterium]